MKITKLDVFPIGMAYARPYAQATGVTEMARRVVVKMHTDEGLIGWGEASTVLPNRTGESALTIAIIIVNHLAPLLIGENPLDIQHVMRQEGVPERSSDHAEAATSQYGQVLLPVLKGCY